MSNTDAAESEKFAGNASKSSKMLF